MSEGNGEQKTGFELIHGVLERKKQQIEAALCKALPLDQFLMVAYTAIQKNPRLMQCDPGSVYVAVRDAATFGLFPNSLTNEGHLIPFYNGNAKRYECQFMVGYKGMLNMAEGTDLVKGVDVRKVFKADEFRVEFGTNPDIHHVPELLQDRGDFIGAYAVIFMKSGHTKFDFISASDALSHGERFSKSKNKKGELFGPWKDDFEAMAMKTVLRMAMKYMPTTPKSEKLHMMIGRDEMQEGGYGDFVDIDPKPPIAEPRSIDDPEPVKDPARETDDETGPVYVDPDTGEVIPQEVIDAESAPTDLFPNIEETHGPTD
ncbi:MAG: hypothetical protein GWM98_11670 [Nitrospinaceae bacterium]|nr:hypothetical protein [Nitrospinaceae bacterium]NIR55042.1 hypothetical protein [Nitrospinaceae bacterium]NIS85441.1 hypothetical protein [Nitrospinaceae bacterium]NIT82280.1 hypothetical protein [Nitrospinaceae bacterium]NIU44511.1 hypothetical protein [Nitrospinaceae bacterium]